ncbi:unnamed protein product [Ectocarpus sp. CCAP 1310/34]|nr:unnamed protein product [Ectocarpus sp. CCAP 1310/34]
MRGIVRSPSQKKREVSHSTLVDYMVRAVVD